MLLCLDVCCDYPLQLIHCIVWAKELALAKLFGDKSQVSDLDVRPSSNEDSTISNDPNESRFFEVRNGESSKAFAARVFDRIFGDNIETALQNEDTWKARRRPHPLYLDKILCQEDLAVQENGANTTEETTVSAMTSLGLKNPQEIWSVRDNARVFLECVQLFLEKRSTVNSAGYCIWNDCTHGLYSSFNPCFNLQALKIVDGLLFSV